jgi:predicted Ser/Thr protein kinase
MNMNTEKICSGCATPIAADAPQGLCPQCLMKAGLETKTDPNAPGPNANFPAPPPPELAHYFPQLEILELLGQGGMGVVYKARQPGLDRLVALKLLSPEGGKFPNFAQRFTQEARSLARLNHPNIVTVYDFGQAGPYYYLMMEYVDGLNLRQSLRQIAPDQALAIVPKICEALQYAHDEGIVHRDIKPENILVDKKGRVKIADFGLAKLLGRAPEDLRLTHSQQVMGTPHYMAPEQIEKPLTVDHRADIYSLGVVFYEMLTGELPVGRFPLPSSTKSGIDVRLDDVVLRTLEKEPQRRYQQASELKSEVETISGIVEKLPPHMRKMFGFEYKSQATIFGIPLLHVALGIDPITGKRRMARGIMAVGDRAQGVVALGGIAIGFFAMGGLALGVVPVGGLAAGLLAVGGCGLGLLASYSGLAIAPVAIGGVALGYYSFGGAAFGVHPFGGNAQDNMARHFFGHIKFGWINITVWTLVAVSFIVPMLTALLKFKFSGRSVGANTGSATKTSFAASVPPPSSAQQNVPPASPPGGGSGSSGAPGQVPPAFAAPAPAPRFSRAAIWGAVLIPIFLFGFVGMYFTRAVQTTSDQPPEPHLLPYAVRSFLSMAVPLLMLMTPIFTTILGAVALGHIRHSRGRIIGLPLALADTLIYPVLLMDVLLYSLWYMLMTKAFGDQVAATSSEWFGLAKALVIYALPFVSLLVLDVVIVIIAWRAAKKPVAQG